MHPTTAAVAAFLAVLAAAAANVASGSPLKGCDSQKTYNASPVDVDLPVPVVPQYSMSSSEMDYASSHQVTDPTRNYGDDGSGPADANKVELPYGSFTGFTFSPYNDTTKVRVHLGIPYAKAPVGDLRFLAPLPITEDLGDRTATSFGPTCIQNVTSTYPFPQSEDCLFVNVYAPANIPYGTKLPVMVWVYGGNFDSGSSSLGQFNGSTMVHRSIELGQEVIVVSFNYRTGVMGFLASPEIQSAGGSNAGLKDQIAAFQWVRQNIGAFGGDANKVTAFGESAGSCSIANHLTATLPASSSAPLFDAAILESSGVHFGYTYNWTTIYGTITAGLFSVTGCKDIACLRGLSADALRAAQNVMEANGATFRPYVDGDYIPTNPQKRLLSGDFMQVPVLVGTNTDEGTFFTSTTTPDQYSALLDKAFPGLPSSLAATIYSLYPLNNYTSTIFGATAAPFLASADLIGDWALHCPSQRVADAYSLLSTAVDPADGKPLVFRYHFNHVPTYLPSSLRIFGVAHSFEIPYVFAAPETQASAGEDALAREMVSMWTFFGQSAGRGGLNGWKGQTVEWPKYEAVAALGAGGGMRMRIDGAGSYAVEVDNVRTAKCNVWNALTAAISTP